MLVSQISTAINGRVNEPKHQINKVYLCNSNSHRPTHQSFSVVHRKALEFFKISSSVRLGQNTDRFIYSIDYKPRKITPGWMTQQCMSELWISISCLLLLDWSHPTKQSTPLTQYQHTNSPHWSPYISLRFNWENLIKDQSIYSLVIILLILMTFLLTLNQHCKERLKERCHAICVLFLKPKTFSHQLNSGNNGTVYFFFQNYRKSSVKPPRGTYLFEAHLSGNFNCFFGCTGSFPGCFGRQRSKVKAL